MENELVGLVSPENLIQSGSVIGVAIIVMRYFVKYFIERDERFMKKQDEREVEWTKKFSEMEKYQREVLESLLRRSLETITLASKLISDFDFATKQCAMRTMEKEHTNK